MAKLAFGTKLWLCLFGLVLGGDLYALWNNKETFSEAFYKSLHHPIRRWIVVAVWIATTKHLFTKKIPWLDPYAIMALGVKTAKIPLRRDKWIVVSH